MGLRGIFILFVPSLVFWTEQNRDVLSDADDYHHHHDKDNNGSDYNKKDDQDMTKNTTKTSTIKCIKGTVRKNILSFKSAHNSCIDLTLKSWAQTLGACLPSRLVYPGSWWRENVVCATVPKLLNTHIGKCSFVINFLRLFFFSFPLLICLFLVSFSPFPPKSPSSFLLSMSRYRICFEKLHIRWQGAKYFWNTWPQLWHLETCPNHQNLPKTNFKPW